LPSAATVSDKIYVIGGSSAADGNETVNEVYG